MRKVIALIFIGLILVSFAAASDEVKEKEQLKIGDPAPDFTLKDADDKEYSLKLMLGKEKERAKVIILIMGNRKVRKQGDKWAIELDKFYKKKEEVVILMVADLRDLPFFVTEGMVKWGVKREKIPVTILLDWGGKVNKLYKAKKSKPNLLIIDSDGKISYHGVGKYSDESMKKVRAKVRESLGGVSKSGMVRDQDNTSE